MDLERKRPKTSAEIFLFKKAPSRPDRCGSVGWVSSCKAKSCWFDSQSVGDMPGLQVRTPAGVHVNGD